jgi:hypothetical protein
MTKPRRADLAGKFLHGGAGMLGLAALLGVPVLLAAPATSAAQLHVVNISVRQAVGRVVFCVTKDTIFVAAVDGGSASALPGGATSHPPAIVPIGAGHMAVLLGATDWTRDGKPTLLDKELPALVTKAFNATPNVDPAQSTADIESIGLTLLEFIRPVVEDIHYNLDLASDEPLVELLLAGYTEGYGPEIWELQYRVQQQDLGSDYWDSRPLRPAYYQLYPPEKGEPKTFIEARYPAKLAPLDLARATQSDPAVSRIRSASQDTDEAVASILNGESDKAKAQPTEDFLRLAIPAVAGAQAQLTIAAVDEQFKFAWVLAPENAPPAPAETRAQPVPQGQQQQINRPSLRRAGPSTTK